MGNDARPCGLVKRPTIDSGARSDLKSVGSLYKVCMQFSVALAAFAFWVAAAAVSGHVTWNKVCLTSNELYRMCLSSDSDIEDTFSGYLCAPVMVTYCC